MRRWQRSGRQKESGIKITEKRISFTDFRRRADEGASELFTE